MLLFSHHLHLQRMEMYGRLNKDQEEEEETEAEEKKVSAEEK